VVSGIERDIPLQEIFRGAMPFLFMLIIAAGILLAFPQLCLFLPYAGR
jgi:TRAP-type mannitol/chloroaromatic compound transport system permease large subunit